MQGALQQGSRSIAQRQTRDTGGGRVLRRTLLYAILVAVALVFVIPFLFLVATSLKPGGEVWAANFLPNHPTLDNYKQLFTAPDAPLPRWLLNSVIAATLHGTCVLLVCAPAAYAYARLEFPGRNLIFALLVGTLLLPFVVSLVPNYLIVYALHWNDTFAAIVLPGLGGAFGVFFLRQFFLSLPTEMEEAMLIDGASRFRILRSLVIPLSKGALATLFVLSFLANWNDYLWPLLTLNSQSMLTLPVGIATFQGEYASTQPALAVTGALVATIPVLVIFTALQKFIVQSVASAGIKG